MTTANTLPRSGPVGYAGRTHTKAPNWHGLVVADVLLNNLTTGLFLAAAVGELAAPVAFAPLAVWAYPLALLFLTADLLCLVLDLGHKTRFHHMLRVFKPSSPMSLGTWCLTAYSLPLTLIVANQILVGNAVVHTVMVVAGLLPAFGSAMYKGVLFSTTAQPGWRDARWLGGYLTNSAVLLGCGVLWLLAYPCGGVAAVGHLRPAFVVLVSLNAVTLAALTAELWPALRAVYPRGQLRGGMAAVAVVGFLVPAGLVVVTPGLGFVVVGVALVVMTAYAVRHVVVLLPHRYH